MAPTTLFLVIVRSAAGTVISASRDMSGVLVTSIVLKNNVTLVDIISTRMTGQFGFLAYVFDAFKRCRISVDVVATSEVGGVVKGGATPQVGWVVGKPLRRVG